MRFDPRLASIVRTLIIYKVSNFITCLHTPIAYVCNRDGLFPKENREENRGGRKRCERRISLAYGYASRQGETRNEYSEVISL